MNIIHYSLFMARYCVGACSEMCIYWGMDCSPCILTTPSAHILMMGDLLNNTHLQVISNIDLLIINAYFMKFVLDQIKFCLDTLLNVLVINSVDIKIAYFPIILIALCMPQELNVHINGSSILHFTTIACIF